MATTSITTIQKKQEARNKKQKQLMKDGGKGKQINATVNNKWVYKDKPLKPSLKAILFEEKMYH